MAEIELERKDLKNGLPHLCMLCGETPAPPQTRITLAPVPSGLSFLSPLLNAVHPDRQWVGAPMCPPCASGYGRNKIMGWLIAIIILGSAGFGVMGLWHASVVDVLAAAGAAGVAWVFHLIWTTGPGSAHTIHCRKLDPTYLWVRLPNAGFGIRYRDEKKQDKLERQMATPDAPPPMIVENPEVVEKPEDPTSPYLEGEKLARIPEELTEFMLAVKEGEFEKLEKYLKKGASWEEHTPEGLYPIHIATLVGASDIVNELMTLGQDINRRAPHGLHPIHLAVQCNYSQLVGLMLARKVSPNVTNDAGQTPLHWACATADLRLAHVPRYKMIKQLLAAGADMNLKDKEGRTPGDLAQLMSHTEALEALGLKEEEKLNEDAAPDQKLFRPVAREELE